MLVEIFDAIGLGLVPELAEAIIAALLFGPRMLLAAMSLVVGGA